MKNFASPAFFPRRQTVRQQAQRGITTVQVAIGILVSVIALVGSFAGFQYVQQAKVNTDVAAMADLKAATMRYGSVLGTNGFTNGNSSLIQLISMGFFGSSAFSVSNGSIPVLNQYQGQVSVALPTEITSNDGLTFSFFGMPATSCRDVAMRIDNLAVAIQGGGNNSVTHNIKVVSGTMDPASVIAACSGTGSTNMLRVTFTRT
jgi:hypothetical protein